MTNVGVYVHVPFCKAKCRYCSFVSTVNPSGQSLYVGRVTEEIASFRDGLKADTVYFGGGTPSCLYPGALTEIFAAIKNKFAVTGNAEITCEANPESATPEFLEECLKIGVNRLSFGLQCADDGVLKKAGRLHDVAAFVRAVKMAKLSGISNISADFIIGLEGETRDILKKTLDLIVENDIRHVSAYSLSVEKGSIMFRSDYRPDEDAMADDYAFAVDYLRQAGFSRYEVSNFSKNGQISRHNYKYWTHAPYVGFGPSAHSYYDNYRVANTDNIAAYLSGRNERTKEFIDLDQKREETVMLRLRLAEGLDLSEYEKEFGEDLLKQKSAEVKKLSGLGVIGINGERLFVTDKGEYVLNSIITELI